MYWYWYQYESPAILGISGIQAWSSSAPACINCILVAFQNLVSTLLATLYLVNNGNSDRNTDTVCLSQALNTLQGKLRNFSGFS